MKYVEIRDYYIRRNNIQPAIQLATTRVQGFSQDYYTLKQTTTFTKATKYACFNHKGMH